MVDAIGAGDMSHPALNLTSEEKRIFGQLFQQADTEKLGVVTGEVAVKFFERTKLAPQVLGEIWQIADTENRGLLTDAGFCIVLRLIGHYQAGRDPSPELALRPGPLPKFDGMTLSAPPAAAPVAARPLQPQSSGGVRVPPLTSEKANEYAALFEKSGSQNGFLSGDIAKSIFEKARLPNDILGRIWNLADTEQRGALNTSEFIVAMHLLASYKGGAMQSVPATLPPGLFDAAARRGNPIVGRPGNGARGVESGIPRQFSGQRNQSPVTRQSYATPPQSAQTTGGDWLITPQDKANYDSLFSKVDTAGRNVITGEQAVGFFSDSGLPEDVLATIWDLADINSQGQLSRDEFAVAMHLIRQSRRPGAALPKTLPPNLVPPSLRGQARVQQPTQSSAPAFEPPKSASDDLFGLDAMTAPPTSSQSAQATGSSTNFSRPIDSDPFGNKSSPTSPQTFQPTPRNPASTFKPFTPQSAFGVGLSTQPKSAADSPGVGQSRGIQPGAGSGLDDLLGDNDPEVSRKLTQDTTELANMSNQIGNLRTQMQEVQSNKTAAESDLTGVKSQKRDLELRLTQFRTQYENEVQAVKALEERLRTSRAETRKLQQDYAMIEGTYQDLQTQHNQVGSALENDQRENANLKERIRQLNNEMAQLRPQLEKMKSDARHQKGVVAISKKQLSSLEGERDKARSDMADLRQPAYESSRSAVSTPQEGFVASPAASTNTQSTNPFFRRSPQPSMDSNIAPLSRDGPSSQRDFDNIFGSSQGTPQGGSSHPPTSFRTESQSAGFSGQSGPSVRSSEPDVPTPSTSPPASSYQESPLTGEPPAPPESRQFGSSLLPLREGPVRTDSLSSSVKVSAPGSRYGGGTGAETPTNVSESTFRSSGRDRPSDRSEVSRSGTGNFSSSGFDRSPIPSTAAGIPNDMNRLSTRTDDTKSSTQDSRDAIPGAFPQEATSPIQAIPTGDSAPSENSRGASDGFTSNRSEPFSSSRDPPRGASSKADFDSAFAGFGNRQYQERSQTGTSANGSVDSGARPRINQEFPPIENREDDDDSDTNSEGGFADNFTTASPQQSRVAKGPVSESRGISGTDSIQAENPQLRPPFSHTESATTDLPTPGAQKSPPTYEQAFGQERQNSGPTAFPPEFGGLLPSREDPTAQNDSPSLDQAKSTSGGQGQNLFGGSPASNRVSSAANAGYSASPPPTDTPASTAASDAYHSVVSHPSADKGSSPSTQARSAVGRSTFGDDFDSGFDDLADARESDDKIDDDFPSSHHGRNQQDFDDFNPTFDSPAASKSSTMASQHTSTTMGRSQNLDDSFGDFDSLNTSVGTGNNKPLPSQPGASSSSHDWDDIFSKLDGPKDDEAGKQDQFSSSSATAAPEGASSSTTLQSGPRKGPQGESLTSLGRAISSGTEHDDPILKKLTGMGYARNDALRALEKYDYDINKAAEYLTSGR